jgi:D-alanyl-D-alanine carboxypeptidase/D-alanyl-D-alanine-endopeptidase (penicillin-binding protein 4)
MSHACVRFRPSPRAVRAIPASVAASTVVALSLVIVPVRAELHRATDAELPLQAVARSVVGVGQGVFVETVDGAVLAALNADRAVLPASLVKVATTLALLKELGPEHRFETRVLASGPFVDGAVDGRLIVEAGADPFLVFENAFLTLLELNSLGIRRVTGGLEVHGSLFFNWLEDPVGRRLQRTFAGRDGRAAWRAVQSARQDAAPVLLQDVALEFVEDGTPPQDEGTRRLLVVHRSPPLRRIVKELNCYSNNIFHALSEHIGGPTAVERIARETLGPRVRSTLVIANAAGAGRGNRLSPRAAVRLLQALAREAERHGLSLADVLPVAGVDPGTLEDRLRGTLHGGTVVGKTGTWGSLAASALAGTVRTRRHGDVTFAVLNRGLTVPEARRRQDAFARALVAQVGAIPWPYEPAAAPAFTEARLEVFRPAAQ